MELLEIDSHLFISISYLKKHGKAHAVKKWRTAERAIGLWETVNSELYIRYDSIPDRTRKRLPSLSVLKNYRVAEQKKTELKSITKDEDRSHDYKKSLKIQGVNKKFDLTQKNLPHIDDSGPEIARCT